MKTSKDIGIKIKAAEILLRNLVSYRFSKDFRNVERLCDNVIEAFTDLHNSHAKLLIMNKALYYKAMTYVDADRYKEALILYNKVIEAYDEKLTEEMKYIIAHSMLQKVYLIEDLKKYPKAIQQCIILEKTFQEDEHPSIIRNVVASIHARGCCYTRLGRYNEAINIFRELLDRCEGISKDDQKIQSLVTKALYNLGICYGKKHHYNESLEYYTRLIEEYSDSTNSEVIEVIRKAKQEIKSPSFSITIGPLTIVSFILYVIMVLFIPDLKITELAFWILMLIVAFPSIRHMVFLARYKMRKK